MTERKRELARRWLIKAQPWPEQGERHDLATARRLSKEPEPYLDTAIYHCQQAAEKTLKGFLVFHDQAFEKTHDIEVLLGMAASYHEKFSHWLEIGERLTDYATAFRYPDVVMEPTRAEFEQALENAENIYAFVLSVLPPEVRP